MSNQPPNQPPSDHKDLKVAEVKEFFKIASQSRAKADSLLEMHYTREKVVGPETLQCLCELFAMSAAFESYLEKNFAQIHEVPDTALFRATAKHVLSIVRMTVAISDLNYELTKSNISVKLH